MISVAEFLSTESGDNKNFIEFLLGEMRKLEDNGTVKYVFSFNMYDLNIDFKNREVIISENLFLNNDVFLNLTLDGFYTELFNCYEK